MKCPFCHGNPAKTIGEDCPDCGRKSNMIKVQYKRKAYPKRLMTSRIIGQALYSMSVYPTKAHYVRDMTKFIVKFIQNNYRRRVK